MRWRAGVRISIEVRDISLRHSVQNSSGALCPGVKWPAGDDSSPPSGAKVKKNSESTFPLPPTS